LRGLALAAGAIPPAMARVEAWFVNRRMPLPCYYVTTLKFLKQNFRDDSTYGGLCGMPACGQAVGCGVCDTPELWCGAAGLCARVCACAGAAECLHTYINIGVLVMARRKSGARLPSQSAQCLHEIRRRVNMDLYEDGRCARHATFNISAAGMDSMGMLMIQVSTCIGSLAALVLRYTFGTARRAGQHRIDVDHAKCSMRCRRLDGVLAYSSYSGAWRRRSAICPLRASLVRLFAFCILRDWALLAAAGCFSCRQGCQARPSGAGARQEACAVCQGASDAPTGKVRRLIWVQMGPTWHF